MRKKSLKEKTKEGTHRSDRTFINQDKGMVKLPAVPKGFDKTAAKHYRAIGTVMLEKEVLQPGFVPLLLQASTWFALLEQFSKITLEVDSKGDSKAIQKFKNGTRQISPEFTIMCKAQDEVLKFSKLFGLTPYDFERIAALQSEPEGDDPFTKFFSN